MNKVYQVQERLTPNKVGGQTVLTQMYDTSDARRFGDIVMVFTSNEVDENLERHHHIARVKLRTFSDDDYLLFIGNPILEAVVFKVACDMNHNRARILSWNRHRNRYDVYKYYGDHYESV